MTKLNPLIEAIGEIDETMIEKAQTKAKKRVGLRIAIIAAAAALLLGTTAAATFGDNPIVKINNQKVKARYSSYVNEDGWTVETTAVELPVDWCRYQPVGEIRAVFDSDAKETACYDELGVRLDKITLWVNLYVHAEKDGEIPYMLMSSHSDSEHHQSETLTPDGKEIEIEFWQDPAQALKSVNDKKRFERMTVDERIEEFKIYGDPVTFEEADGFKCPSADELFEVLGYGGLSTNAVKLESVPSEAMKLYDYAPVSLDGFSEKPGAFVFVTREKELSEDGVGYKSHTITQQMFVYTLVEEQSGTEVLFTVWRSAENKGTYTDHFDFDYDYIPLNNGTNARLHEGLDGIFILEFEKDGAAYGLNLGTERGLVETVLEKMELL